MAYGRVKVGLWLAILSGVSGAVVAGTPVELPCSGPYGLLGLVDRPTIADSACVVPYQLSLVEMGYQYQKLSHGGYQYNLPQGELRIGLPRDNEFEVIFPNYIHQTVSPRAGFGITGVGLKHQIWYNEKWITAIDGLLILPSGSTAFGDTGTGGTVNGIVTYNVTSEFGVSFMLGVTSQTESVFDGGKRFTSVNPDLVLSWTKNRLGIYGEAYGQSKTGPGQGSGFNMDAGILYLLAKNMTFDIEVGQRISGTLGDLSHYVGTGLTVEF